MLGYTCQRIDYIKYIEAMTVHFRKCFSDVHTWLRNEAMATDVLSSRAQLGRLPPVISYESYLHLP